MKVLITGIGGFVGPHLKRELEQSGHEVFGIDRSSKEENIFACDLLDTKAVAKAIEKIVPGVIFHLAAITSVSESWQKPQEYLEINSAMTNNVMRAASKIDDCKVLITSSSDVYGPQDTFPITEDALPNPQNPYAKSKLAQEKVVQDFNEVNWIITRSFNHTGPGTTDSLVVGSFAKQIALCEKGEQNQIKVGNLEAFRDFSDVRDVVRAYRLLVEKGSGHEIFNVCSGKKIQMKEILNKLLKLSENEIQIVEDPEKMRPSDVPEFFGDHQRLTKQTGWTPKIPFNKTLSDTLEFFRQTI